MKQSLSVGRLSRVNRNLISVFCCLLIVTFAWLGVCLDNSAASAEPLLASLRNGAGENKAIATQPTAMNEFKDQVKGDLAQNNRTIGDSGPSNTIKGKIPSEGDSPNRRFDNASKQIQSTEGEVDGRTEKNLAKLQGKDTNSDNKVGDAIEEVMDNIRESVNQ